MTSDAIWRELAEVCVQLSHHDEALAAFAKITDMRHRREIHHLLQRHGLLRRDADGNGDVEDAGPRNLKDEVLDGVRILFEDHMPLTTVVTTMTFPVVVGLGGFLTSTTNSFLFPAIAALPALCVAAIVGGLSRRIFIDAAHGIQDPPRIPELRELSRQSGRFVLDAVVLTLALLGPAILLGLLNGPMASTFVAAALGAFLLPGALAIRQLTDDWRALSPNYLFAAVTRLRGDYMATASICGLVALPAVLATIFTTGSQIYLQASVVGPLAVAPLFFASRLLGLTMHANRHKLNDILGPATQPAPTNEGRRLSRSATPTQQASSDVARPVLRTTTATPPRVTAVERRPAPAVGPLPDSAPRPAAPAHPETKQRLQARPQPAPASQAPAPTAKPKAAPQEHRRPLADKPGPRKAPTPAAAMREPHPLSTINARGAQAQQAPAPEPVVARSRALGGTHQAVGASIGSRSHSSPSAKPAPAEPSAPTEARPTVAVTEKAPPDFTQLPGFNVVTGAARLLSGASSKGKRRP